MRKRFPKGIRKFVRQEKARIRREISDSEKQKQLISDLYEKLFKNYANKTNIPIGN